jgi:hypothetical protein
MAGQPHREDTAMEEELRQRFVELADAVGKLAVAAYDAQYRFNRNPRGISPDPAHRDARERVEGCVESALENAIMRAQWQLASEDPA